MRKAKYLLSGLSVVDLMLVLHMGTAAAGNQLCPANAPPEIQNSEVCKNQSDPISGTGGLLNDVTAVVSIVAGIAAVVMIMVGGYKYITSGGDSSKVQEAKKTIMWSLIGLVVIILARSIILFVLSKV